MPGRVCRMGWGAGWDQCWGQVEDTGDTGREARSCSKDRCWRVRGTDGSLRRGQAGDGMAEGHHEEGSTEKGGQGQSQLGGEWRKPHSWGDRASLVKFLPRQPTVFLPQASDPT